ncbi:MAG: hypothetical protein P4L39_07475 [Humidesulfovibrio sp.]|nr:hypothetical protein [Humidesulfovibrio sp.]
MEDFATCVPNGTLSNLFFYFYMLSVILQKRANPRQRLSEKSGSLGGWLRQGPRMMWVICPKLRTTARPGRADEIALARRWGLGYW